MLRQISHKLLTYLHRLKIQRNFMKNTSIFLEAIPTPVFWLDRNKTYQGCNQVFSDLIGLSTPVDIVGLTDQDLPYSSADLSIRDEVFTAILKGKIQAKILYDCIIGVQDKMIWVQKRFTPLKNHKSKIIGIFGAIIDISEKVNSRKNLETHVEHKRVFGNFLNELNAKSPLSTDYKELMEQSIITLQEESESTLAILINTNTRSQQGFFQFVTNTMDVSIFFENRKAFLKTTSQSGYLDPEVIKLFKDFEQPIDSIFFYRIKLNDVIKYDDVILLINPNKDKLEMSTTYLSLTHHIIHTAYVSKFLAETYQAHKK